MPSKLMAIADPKFASAGKLSKVKNKSPKLEIIKHYLGAWKTAVKGEKEDQLAILGHLYFTTDTWLKLADKLPWLLLLECAVDKEITEDEAVLKPRELEPKEKSSLASDREKVFEFYKEVVSKLCDLFGCTVNTLPNHLEEEFGRSLSGHGKVLDYSDHKTEKGTFQRLGRGMGSSSGMGLTWVDTVCQ